MAPEHKAVLLAEPLHLRDDQRVGSGAPQPGQIGVVDDALAGGAAPEEEGLVEEALHFEAVEGAVKLEVAWLGSAGARIHHGKGARGGDVGADGQPVSQVQRRLCDVAVGWNGVNEQAIRLAGNGLRGKTDERGDVVKVVIGDVGRFGATPRSLSLFEVAQRLHGVEVVVGLHETMKCHEVDVNRLEAQGRLDQRKGLIDNGSPPQRRFEGQRAARLRESEVGGESTSGA